MPRHLPVVQPEETEDALAASRPVWQWVLIGAGFTLTLWMPLAAVALGLGRLAPLGAFVVAAGAAGALVGRFGGAARPVHAAGSAVLAAAVGVSTTAILGPDPAGIPLLGVALAALVVAGAPAALAGARLGSRKRPGRAPPPTAKPRD